MINNRIYVEFIIILDSGCVVELYYLAMGIMTN